MTMNTFFNPLTAIVRDEIIQQGGAISFYTFMQHALYHPEYGYYHPARFSPGPHGDFITAPHVSSLFARTFAKQCELFFAKYELNDILEFGAGAGQFALDLLLALETRHSLPTHYYIYEISVALREKQCVFLKQHAPHLVDRVIWLDALPAQFSGIVIANEVLDAMPVHLFRLDAGSSLIREKCVGWQNEQFVWHYQEPTNVYLNECITSERLKESITSIIHESEWLQAWLNGEEPSIYPFYESEVNLHLGTWIKELAQMLVRGVVLLVDYGYGAREYYHPQRYQGTLSCFHQHRYHANPLIFFGEQDITAHVNFTEVASQWVRHGGDILGYTTQAAFLLDSGLLALAAEDEDKLDAKSQFALHQAIKTLTMPTEMGERIKVMALTKGVAETDEGEVIPGFGLHQGLRDL